MEETKKIALICSIAELLVEARMTDPVWTTSSTGDVHFTDEAQDLFNDTYDIVEGLIERGEI